MALSVLQVETMHDFEAANSDELELKRGDVALVVPTDSLEDQVIHSHIYCHFRKYVQSHESVVLQSARKQQMWRAHSNTTTQKV